MPSIKDDSTVEAIARAFTSNGRNEEQGLITVGYSKSYARGGTGHKLYANVRIKAAIARIDAKGAKKQEADRQYCIGGLQKIADNEKTSDRNRLTAFSLLGDFNGGKREKAPNQEKVDEILARMTDEEIKNRRIVAKMRTDELSGPKLSEDKEIA